MTKAEIFKILLAAVVAALIRPVIEAFMPTKDRLKVLIKKVVIVMFSYLMPAGFLLYLFFNSEPVDKLFIFQVVVFSSILILNITVYLFEKVFSAITLIIDVLKRIDPVEGDPPKK